MGTGVGGNANAEPTNQTADLLFRIPLWMDLSMHLLPAITLIIGMSDPSQSIPLSPGLLLNFYLELALMIDFFVLEKKYKPPASTKGANALATGFGLVYALWIEHAATINHKFPYPFLNVMSVYQRIIFYIFAVGGALATFKLLNSLHR
jgi:hypothetical protein